MLITSISGIRGTLGDVVGENLTPIDVQNFVSAYGTWVLSQHQNPTIVIGRDARESGTWIIEKSIETLTSLGIDVLNLDLATTPTVEMTVIQKQVQGAIIVTASHNPKEYNGLKMLNHEGEFLSADEGQAILDLAQAGNFQTVSEAEQGSIEVSYNHTQDHINAILELELVDADLVRAKNYTVAVDGINSVGGIAVPQLLQKMGVEVVGMNMQADGEFAHMPEPLEKNLGELKALVTKVNADLGIAVDPDVDRLVLVDEKGDMFGEEYTIVSMADYVISQTPGNTVSNLSSSRALRDIAEQHGVGYQASAVGEKNVVELMKQTNAVIGGEGSGGVIYPALHYGRDALVGIALFLTSLAKNDLTASELRAKYPNYSMSKEKVVLSPEINVDGILEHFWEIYQSEQISNIDGVKIDFEDSWVHLRKSNTEPIMRIYTEAKTQVQADELAQRFIQEINNLK